MDQFGLYADLRKSDPVRAVELFRLAISFKVNENSFNLICEARK